MKKILISIGAAVAIAIAWFLLSPIFFDTVVDEELPSSISGLSDTEKMQMEAIESLTQEEVQAMPEAQRMEAKRVMEELGQKMPETIADEPMASSPTVTLQGTFKDADNFHRGSGMASVFTLPDGKHILRFENFTVTNGPALSVYLVRSGDGNVDSGFLDLGKLKGNKGNQNYEIPAGTDLREYGSVIIWCVPFKVTFTTATLQ